MAGVCRADAVNAIFLKSRRSRTSELLQSNTDKFSRLVQAVVPASIGGCWALHALKHGNIGVCRAERHAIRYAFMNDHQVRIAKDMLLST